MHEGDRYSFVKASHDEGVSLELWFDQFTDNSELVLEAFWRASDQWFVVRTVKAEIPFEVFEAFTAEARRWCPLPPS